VSTNAILTRFGFIVTIPRIIALRKRLFGY